MDNINRVCPGKIGVFYERLLKKLEEYPITKQKFYEESLNMIKE